jgi:dynein intermediate chain 2
LKEIFLFSFLGTLDVWDILFKQNEPTLSIQVVDEPLQCLRVQEPQGRLVACGSQNGTVTLIELSDNLCTQGKSEKTLVSGVSLVGIERF